MSGARNIAPVEGSYVRSTAAKRVTMLVDDTPNGAFTIGMADRLQQRLTADGVAVARISVKEVTDEGVAPISRHPPRSPRLTTRG